MYSYNFTRSAVHDRSARYEREAAAERAARDYRAGRGGSGAAFRRAAAAVERLFGHRQDVRAPSRG